MEWGKTMKQNIMIQGTMSSAGKSLICAALCRIFTQDGFKTAPFKSQNMALNSFITEDGAEMGRAQVMQAEAAKIRPDARMNPILLKPTSDVGSQVIVNGHVLGNMPAASYFKYKKQLVPEIMKAYRSLEEEYDIIVIEGAGSPAEINLKKNDIVNMGMAKMVDAPVLLAGDIDRGGVFAQLYGTVALLEEEALILGTRNFSKDTPFKSRYGNHITTAVFALLYGKKIRDTQTGLRGIPYGFLAECLRLEGERFEYEIKMLIDAVRCKWQIKEVEIQTIYVDSNRATHFHAVKDSLRIYRVLFGCFFGFAASGILSFLLDIGLFTLLTKTLFSSLPANLCILGGTVLARICSSLFNFSMNRSLVFKGKGKTSGALIRYYILCVCQMLCSWALVSGLFRLLNWEPSGLKVFVDLVLFFASYQIQRVWVFNKRK